jgi:hypothetical protein
MKTIPLALASLLLALTGSVFAQSGVSTSNDPAKAAAVERHAADIKSHPQATPAVAAKPAARHHAKKHAKKHHAKKHHAKRHAKAKQTAKVSASK